ncbi:MAG: hypothetical protein ACREKH_13930, partial [Candidatus Rokuibacteriota bacterium]
PGYVVQLLFYCAMVKVDRGHVVAISRSSPEIRGFDIMRAWRVEVADLDEVWREAARRRDLLMKAVEDRDPSRLPRCGWYDAGCSFRGSCDCVGGPGDEESGLLRQAKITPDPDEESRLSGLLSANGAAAWKPSPKPEAAGPPPLRLRDLQFIRKRMLEYLEEPREATAEAVTAPSAPEEEDAGKDKLNAISASATSSGMRKLVLRALGVSWTRVSRGVFDDPWVASVAGEPVKFKATRLGNPVDRTEIIRMFPDEVAELGAAGALLGAKKGRLVLYYERAPDERQRLLIYEISIRDTEAFARGLDDIGTAWSEAWEARDASLLPPCPAWAVEKCGFSERCPCRKEQPAAA